MLRVKQSKLQQALCCLDLLLHDCKEQPAESLLQQGSWERGREGWKKGAGGRVDVCRHL